MVTPPPMPSSASSQAHSAHAAAAPSSHVLALMVSARIGRGSGRRLQVAVEVEAGVESATALRFHSATRAEVAQRQHVEVVDEKQIGRASCRERGGQYV